MLEINNRNRTIDFLKFIFAFIIAVYHGTNKLSGGKNQYFQNGRLGVEIYFLFTGYLMVVSFTKCKDIENIGRETFLFLKRKILRLFPNVYIAWLISFSLVHIFTQRKDIMKICLDFIKALPELLLISHSGISWKHYNIPMWYLSVMLISVTIIFPLMLKYKDVFFYIIAPIVFLALMGYLFQTYGEMSTPFIWTGYAYKGMLRGFAGIVGGCICYKISNWLNKYSYTRLMKVMFFIVEWGIYSVSIAYMQFHKASKYDFVVCLILMIAVSITVSNISYDNIIFNKKVFSWLGEYSFSLNLSHWCWIMVEEYVFPIAWCFTNKLILYVAFSLATAIFVMYSSKCLNSWWNKHKCKLIKLIIIK